MTLENLSTADLHAMKQQLIEDKNLYEASGQTDKAHEAATQAVRITEEIQNRMFNNGVMIKS